MKIQYWLLIGLMGAIFTSCNGSNKDDEKKDSKKIEKPENAFFGFNNSCIGCEDAVILDGLLQPRNNEKSIHMMISLGSSGMFRGTRKIEVLANNLEIDSCKILDTNIHNIKKENILDGGNITINANWDGWEMPPFNYDSTVKNYPYQIKYNGVGLNNYTAGAKVIFNSRGGKDVSAFNINANAVTPIILINPKVDDNGQLPEVNSSKALNIVWNGGDSENIIIYLDGTWVNSSEPSQILACRVKNDGKFTIASSILKKFEWGQLTSLNILDSKMTAMPLSCNKNAQLIMSASSSLFIHQDINATLSQPDKIMQIGFVGSSCTNDGECGGGTCFVEEPFFGGYCSLKNCTADSQCPNDAICMIQTSQFSLPNFCAKPCSSDNDCRISDAQVCRAGDNGQKSCVPGVN